MEDKSITEIMVNGAHQIFIQRGGRIVLSDVKFEHNEHLTHTIQKLLNSSGTNRRVDESNPYVDFPLPDGTRCNVILPPCSLVGPVMTIRKFADISTLDDVLRLKMLDENIGTFLSGTMKAKHNIVFCGATGTGKTTLLNVLSRHIDEEERIITIEDTPELRLKQEHVVTLQAKMANVEGKGAISIRDLFVNSLRMRPDRLIIGEVRSDEMLDLIESIASGHSGSLAIVHAESPEDCFSRMTTMMLMTGIKLDTRIIEKQIARAIDLIVHIILYPDGVRRVTNVTDVSWDEEREKPVI
ncbi:MAG TPA: ATPase, T2SS/T4P/T4SS family [Candidatus Omnitrophota bacterium]|nr:ATPase, T2SS/T4P/T4SS family [Candidatus Omnitrophota bacterium]